MPIDITKVKKRLNDYQEFGLNKKHDRDEMDFLPAICYVQLGNYSEARRLFERSFIAMFSMPKMWKTTGQPNWLVDICILSGKKDSYSEIAKELNLYKSDPIKRDSLLALYASSVFELLIQSSTNIEISINGLLKRPKIKFCYAMGQTLYAITHGDQNAFNEGLENLLKSHDGMAKRGDLRETAEGFLCMPAMSLAHIAMRNGMKVELENDYLSTGYLQYLHNSEIS